MTKQAKSIEALAIQYILDRAYSEQLKKQSSNLFGMRAAYCEKKEEHYKQVRAGVEHEPAMWHGCGQCGACLKATETYKAFQKAQHAQGGSFTALKQAVRKQQCADED